MQVREVYEIGRFQGACTSLMRVFFNATQEAGQRVGRGELIITDQIAQARGAFVVLQNLDRTGFRVTPRLVDTYRQVVTLFETGLEMLQATEAGDVPALQQLAASYEEDLRVVRVAVDQLLDRAAQEGDDGDE